jgi:hypothetical protein
MTKARKVFFWTTAISTVSLIGLVALIAAGPRQPTVPEAAQAQSASVESKAPERHDSDAMPKQLHDPSVCRDGDHECIRAGYVEYRDAIINELGQWQTSDAISVIQQRNEYAALHLSGVVVRNGWYVHNHWTIPDNAKVTAAGIDWKEWDALWSCREAILDLKYAMGAVAFPDTADASDKPDYNEALTKCRKRFQQVADLRL